MKRKILFLAVTVILAVLLLASCGEKSDFTYEETEGGIAVTGYNGEDMNVVIPETIGNKTVVAVGEGAFDASGIESVVLPETVKEIGRYAFRRCGKLTSVTIKGKLKVIPEGAFNYCLELKELAIPDTVETIEENAFGKAALIKVILPDTVKTIEDYAFYSCTLMTSFVGGKGLEYIGNNVFGGCIALTELKLNEGLKTVGEYAFSSCISLTSAELPSTVEKLSMGVFSGTPITEYTVSGGIKNIETYAFAGCKNLKKIYIPQTVEEIKNEAFFECKGFVIYGIRDSQAEIFADTYGFKFEEYNFG